MGSRFLRTQRVRWSKVFHGRQLYKSRLQEFPAPMLYLSPPGAGVGAKSQQPNRESGDAQYTPSPNLTHQGIDFCLFGWIKVLRGTAAMQSHLSIQCIPLLCEANAELDIRAFCNAIGIIPVR